MTAAPGPPRPLDDAELAEVEAVAVEAVEAAGAVVAGRFGGELEFEAKGKDGGSPVTEVDRESQRLIAEVVRRRFPGHMVLGEEDAPEEEPPARDFVWCVDPIDGTTNYLNGHAVFALSIGVLYRGAPVAAAAWVPWPAEGGHVTLHARKGGGAWIGGRRLGVRRPEEGVPAKNRLVMIPGSLRAMFSVAKPLKGNFGEPRVTGSIVYELAMVATGVAQFSVTGAGRIWDVAGGVLLVTEAGGAVMTPGGPGGWARLESFDRAFDTDSETAARLRGWHGVVLAGPENVVGFVSEHLRPRRPSLWRRLRRRLI